jgi:hypothetical protein
VSLAVAVVAHPARLAAAEQLATTLSAHLVVDEHQQGEWPTHARALAWAAEQDTSHALVVQDDAVPVPGLLEHVAAAIDAHPDGPIASWLVANTLLWGVATVLPAADLPALLAWGRRCTLPYDQRIGAWYRNQQRPVRYTWPSLVDHADGPSLLTGRARTVPRVAWRTGAPASWDGPVVRIESRAS